LRLDRGRKEKQKKLLEEKIDVTAFVVNYVKLYCERRGFTQ